MYKRQDNGGFACLDPSAPCVDDDDFIPDDDFYFDDEDELSGSFAFEPCLDDFIGDGDCDPTNNNEGCGGSVIFIYNRSTGVVRSNCFPCRHDI